MLSVVANEQARDELRLDLDAIVRGPRAAGE